MGLPSLISGIKKINVIVSESMVSMYKGGQKLGLQL